MRRGGFFLMFVLTLFCVVGMGVTFAAEPKLPEEILPLVQLLQEGREEVIEDVSADFLGRSLKYSEVASKRFGFSWLERYYRKSFDVLREKFPEGTFQFDFSPVQKFSGEVISGAPDTFLFPALAIVPEGAYIPADLKFEILKISAAGKEIPGLRVSARINPGLVKALQMQKTKGPFFIPYLPDVNARILGFQSAQIVIEASRNVGTADVFDYNGLLSWKDHSRYERVDQASGPISLTNIAHTVGESLVISSHPDFALKLLDINTPARLTFFLWKRPGYSGKGSSPIRFPGVPDFVFSVDLLT